MGTRLNGCVGVGRFYGILNHGVRGDRYSIPIHERRLRRQVTAYSVMYNNDSRLSTGVYMYNIPYILTGPQYTSLVIVMVVTITNVS